MWYLKCSEEKSWGQKWWSQGLQQWKAEYCIFQECTQLNIAETLVWLYSDVFKSKLIIIIAEIREKKNEE